MPRFFILLILCISSQFGLAGKPVDFKNTNDAIELKAFADFYIDNSTEFSIVDILDLESINPAIFQSLPEREGPINFGFISGAAWLKFTLVNHLPQSQQVVFDFNNPRLSDIQIFQFDDGELIFNDHGGDNLPISERQFQSRSIPFPITLPPNQAQTIYFRIDNYSLMKAPLTLYSEQAFFAQKHKNDITMYAILGIYLGFVFYNLMIFIGQRDKIYLSFFAMTLGRLLYDLYLSGEGQLLTPNLLYWNDVGYMYCGSLAAFLAVWFHVEF